MADEAGFISLRTVTRASDGVELKARECIRTPLSRIQSTYGFNTFVFGVHRDPRFLIHVSLSMKVMSAREAPREADDDRRSWTARARR